MLSFHSLTHILFLFCVVHGKVSLVIIGKRSAGNAEGPQKGLCLARSLNSHAQRITLEACAVDSTGNPLVSQLWVYTKDGKILSPNGRCLSLVDEEVVAGTCETAWTFEDHALRVKDTNLCLALDDESSIRQVKVVESDSCWHWLLAPSEALRGPSIESDQYPAFRQTSRTLSDSRTLLAQLEVGTVAAAGQVEVQEKLLESIDTDLTAVHEHLAVENPLSGDGALLEFFEPGEIEPQRQAVIPDLRITIDTLKELQLAMSTPLAVRLSGRMSSPLYGLVTFRFKNLTSDIDFHVNGRRVMQLFSAPVEASVVESDAVELSPDSTLVDFVITSTGTIATPLFEVAIGYQGEDNDVPISKEHLFPSRFGLPVCSEMGPDVHVVDCDTTFEEFAETQSGRKIKPDTVVYCPSSCLERHPSTIYGDSSCFHIASSICYSGIAAGVITSGFLSVSSEPGVKGRFDSTGHLAPASNECAQVMATDLRGAPFIVSHVSVVKSDKVVDQLGQDFQPNSGRTGRPSDPNRIVMLEFDFGSTSNAINSVNLHCDHNQADTDLPNVLEIDKNLALSYTYARAKGRSADYPLVGELFLTDRDESPAGLPLESLLSEGTWSGNKLVNPGTGWSRQVCGSSSKQRQLYTKYLSKPQEMLFPSREVQCTSTFADLNIESGNALESVVRCPDNCNYDNSTAPIYGLFTYTSPSLICKSAVHAGAINVNGGAISIRKSFTPLYVKDSLTRNGVSALSASKGEAPNYYVDIPRGLYCSYPQDITSIRASSLKLKNETPDGQEVPVDISHPIIISFLQQNSTWLDSISDVYRNKREQIENLIQRAQHVTEHQSSLRLSLAGLNSELSSRKKLLETEVLRMQEDALRLPIQPHEDLFTSFEKEDQLSSDWSIWDSQNAGMGPSQWELTPRSLRQKSSIFATQSNGVGTMLIYRAGTYREGFMACEVKLSGRQGYGSLGFVTHYLNDNYYLLFELQRLANDIKSIRIVFKEMHNGELRELPGARSCSKSAVTPMWIAIDFGPTSARAIVDGDSSCATGYLAEMRLRSTESFIGKVGLFTNGLSLQTEAVFERVTFGPLSVQANYAKDAFGSLLDAGLELQLPDKAEVKSLLNSKENLNLDSEPVVIDEILKSNETSKLLSGDVTKVSGCHSEYVQILDGSSPMKVDWLLPSDMSSVAASVSNGQLVLVKAQTSLTSSHGLTTFLLIKPPCTHSDVTIVETSMALGEKAKGGLIFRVSDSLETSKVILVDSTPPTKNIYEISYLDVSAGKTEVLHQTTTELEGAWLNLTLVDRGIRADVYGNGRLLATSMERPMIVSTRLGLVLETGKITIRSFQMRQLSLPSLAVH